MNENGKTQTAVRVDVRNLRKSYGKQAVLKGLSFSVEPGEIFVIMGPSGSGKSVLLKQIIGLEHPDGGEVMIGDGNAADRETHRRYVTAIVFQDGALFNSMSVYDNLALYPREHRLYDRNTLDQKVRSTLSLLSLDGAAHKMPSELSGGMKKRVAVARALMMEPQLLLYDEPTSELDPELAATTTELIAAVRKETGLTSIVVTHDRDLARAIADRIVLLRDGQIAFSGTPSDLEKSTDETLQNFLNPKIDPENPRFRLGND